mgnify:CR=1 FL=1
MLFLTLACNNWPVSSSTSNLGVSPPQLIIAFNIPSSLIGNVIFPTIVSNNKMSKY